MVVFKKSNQYSRIARILSKYLNNSGADFAKRKLLKRRKLDSIQLGKSASTFKDPLIFKNSPLNYTLKTTVFTPSYGRITKLLTLSAVYNLENLLYPPEFYNYSNYISHNCSSICGRYAFQGFSKVNLYTYDSHINFKNYCAATNCKLPLNPWTYLYTSDYLVENSRPHFFVNPVKSNGTSTFIRITERQPYLTHREFFKIFLYFKKPRTLYYEDMEEEYFKFHTRFKVFESNYNSHWFSEIWWSVLSSLNYLNRDQLFDNFSFFWTLSTHDFNFDPNFLLRLLVYEEIAWPFFSPIVLFKNDWRLLFMQNFPLYLFFFLYRNIPEMWDEDDSVIKQEGDLKNLTTNIIGLAHFKKYVKYDYFVKLFSYPSRFFSKLSKYNFFIFLLILVYYFHYSNPVYILNKQVLSKELAPASLTSNLSYRKLVSRRRLLQIWRACNNLPSSLTSTTKGHVVLRFEFFSNRFALRRTIRFPWDLEDDILEDYDEEWFELEEEEEPLDPVLKDIDNPYLSYFYDKVKISFFKLFVIHNFFLTDSLSLTDYSNYNPTQIRRIVLSTLRRNSKNFIYKAKRTKLLGVPNIFNKSISPNLKHTTPLITVKNRIYLILRSDHLLRNYFSYNNLHKPLFLFFYVIRRVFSFIYSNLELEGLMGMLCSTIRLSASILFYKFITNVAIMKADFSLLKFFEIQLPIFSYLETIIIKLRSLRLFFFSSPHALTYMSYITNSLLIQSFSDFAALICRVRKRSANSMISTAFLILNPYLFYAFPWLLSGISASAVNYFLNTRFLFFDINATNIKLRFWFLSISYYLSDFFSVEPRIRLFLSKISYYLLTVFIFFLLCFLIFYFYSLIIFPTLPLALVSLFIFIYSWSQLLRKPGFADVRNMPVLQFFELARTSGNNSTRFIYFLREFFLLLWRFFLNFTISILFLFSFIFARFYPISWYLKLFFSSVRWFFTFWATAFNKFSFVNSYKKDLKLKSSKIYILRLLFFLIFIHWSQFNFIPFIRVFIQKTIWYKLNLIGWIWFNRELLFRLFGSYGWWVPGFLNLSYKKIDRRLLLFSNSLKIFFFNSLTARTYYNKFNYVNLSFSTKLLLNNSFNFFFKYFMTFSESAAIRIRVDLITFFFHIMEKFFPAAYNFFAISAQSFYDDVLLEDKFSNFTRNDSIWGPIYNHFHEIFATFNKFSTFIFKNPSTQNSRTVSLLFFSRNIYALLLYSFKVFACLVFSLLKWYLCICLILFLWDLSSALNVFVDFSLILFDLLFSYLGSIFFIPFIFLYLTLKLFFISFLIKKFI